MLPTTRTAMLSRTSVQFKAFRPLVKGLRWVMANRETKTETSNMTPSTVPTTKKSRQNVSMVEYAFRGGNNLPARFISKSVKFIIKDECFQTIEKTIEMMPAAKRAKSRPAQTAVSL